MKLKFESLYFTVGWLKVKYALSAGTTVGARLYPQAQSPLPPLS